MLGLLGRGPEVESCGRFLNELAEKIPAALESIHRGDDALRVLQEDLCVPRFRAVMTARLLSLVSPALYDFNRRDIDDYAVLGLWLLVGLEPEQARAVVGAAEFTQGVDPIFRRLVSALPDAVAAADEHGIVEKPMCAQNIEHFLCEFRKMVLPGKRHRGGRYDGYAALWREVAPILARRAP